MMLLTLSLLAGATAAPASHQPVTEPVPVVAAPQSSVSWTAPSAYVPGHPFVVEVEVDAKKGSAIPAVWTGTAGFTVDGAALGEGAGTFEPTVDMRFTVRLDLAESLSPTGAFQLGLAGSEETKSIRVLTPAAAGLDFMTIPAAELPKYGVLLRTNQGDMLAELWDETAPNHARNFLDLSYTEFYDGVLFHRCIPGFVIQGGDPSTKDPKTDPMRYGTGNGPRKLDAEFSARPHERGVLSAARLGGDVNSATSQFFVCHARVASLDRQYTAFGALRYGHEVMDKIVNAPKAIDEMGIDPRTGQPRRRPSDRPAEPQVIEKAIVVLLPDEG